MQTKQRTEYICFVAGKSGGHIIPALTLAKQMKSEDASRKIIFFSTDAALDSLIISQDGTADLHYVLKFASNKKWYYLPIVMFQVLTSFIKSVVKLVSCRPMSVVSMGGLVSLPVVIAAWMLRIPVTLYELNAVPGRAIKVLCRFAKEIYICFDVVRPLLAEYDVTKVNYPVRFGDNEILSKHAARTRLGFSHEAHILLVLGGSQGSRFLNTFAESYVRHRVTDTQSPFVVIHQAGVNDVEDLSEFYQSLGITAHVFAYKHDLAPYYSAADVAIARAGAGLIFELQFFGLKTLLVPLEASTTDHQLDNAYAAASRRSDLFTVVRQDSVQTRPESAYRYLDQFLS